MFKLLRSIPFNRATSKKLFASAILLLAILLPATRASSAYGQADGKRERLIYLEQNWTPEVRQAFYNTPQGSHLIPLKFALALEAPQSGQAFFTSRYLVRYGFLPQQPDRKRNPLGLPIGLTIDGYTGIDISRSLSSVNKGQRYIGMNCAACHTNNLKYDGKTVRIDGGQSLFDLQSFMNGMDQALLATGKDEAKLVRFIDRVQRMSRTRESKSQLRAEFSKFLEERKLWQKMNFSEVRYGFGRVDALGVIFNQILARSLRVPENAYEPTAPVSYPVIWDTPHHDFVQWNGVADNTAATGALKRNVGQVLGVFGHVDIFNPTKGVKGYCTSARRKNLVALEKWTRDLVSPQWPEEVFGEIDPVKAARGRSHYGQRCLNCHAVLDNSRSPARTVKAVLIPASILGVDPSSGLNAGRVVRSGPLRGRMTKITSGRGLDELEPATILIDHVITGAVAGSVNPLSCRDQIDADPRMIVDAWRFYYEQSQKPAPADPLDQLPAPLRNSILGQAVSRLKARPLNGIWASPPFLHNGSIKSIYELLLPAAERSTKFVVGCSDYDPSKMGYECGTPEALKHGAQHSVLDATVAGSRNSGHDYGVGLSEADRMDLLEYLKTL